MKNVNIIGKCPYCKNGMIHKEKKIVNGKNTYIYTCSNARWITEDGEMFELTKDSTCSFRIWGNSLSKWGKKTIFPKEVRELLKKREIEVKLYSFRTQKEYTKTLILDKEYGVSVLWD